MENKNEKVTEVNQKEVNSETKKAKVSKKELIITITVLIIAIIVGFLGGKALYEAMYGAI